MSRYKRQIDIIKAKDLTPPIHIIGAGGIGSWTALTLAKVGCSNITVYDNDIVEDHNIASQFYKESQLGMSKVKALRENILEQTGFEINIFKNIKEEEFIVSNLVLITVDSMEERIRLGKLYKDMDNYIIDARMGGLSMELHSISSNEYLSTTVPIDKVDH
jgi:tRNA A37 threonylcarbamoyladenosine dehydratase